MLSNVFRRLGDNRTFLLSTIGLMMAIMVWPIIWLKDNQKLNAPGKIVINNVEIDEKYLHAIPRNAVDSLDSILIDLVNKENETTNLLEQKASVQIGAISIVIAIILAVVGFLFKEYSYQLSKEYYKYFISSCTIVIVLFIVSIFASYQCFRVRYSFAAYNIDNAIEIFQESNTDSYDLRIYNILENYDIYKINGSNNAKKSKWLGIASYSCFLGLIIFSFLCLIAINFHSRPFKGGDNSA